MYSLFCSRTGHSWGLWWSFSQEMSRRSSSNRLLLQQLEKKSWTGTGFSGGLRWCFWYWRFSRRSNSGGLPPHEKKHHVLEPDIAGLNWCFWYRRFLRRSDSSGLLPHEKKHHVLEPDIVSLSWCFWYWRFSRRSNSRGLLLLEKKHNVLEPGIVGLLIDAYDRKDFQGVKAVLDCFHKQLEKKASPAGTGHI